MTSYEPPIPAPAPPLTPQPRYVEVPGTGPIEGFQFGTGIPYTTAECAVCVYIEPDRDEPLPAATFVNGTALCAQHIDGAIDALKPILTKLGIEPNTLHD